MRPRKPAASTRPCTPSPPTTPGASSWSPRASAPSASSASSTAHCGESPRPEVRLFGADYAKTEVSTEQCQGSERVQVGAEAEADEREEDGHDPEGGAVAGELAVLEGEVDDLVGDDCGAEPSPVPEDRQRDEHGGAGRTRAQHPLLRDPVRARRLQQQRD